MRILEVHIRNYGALRGEHHFKLNDRGLTLVLGDNQDELRMDSNGAAKSTLFEALDWCLFGVVPRGDHVDSVINDFEKDLVVSTILDDNGLKLEVFRRKSRGKSAELFFESGGSAVQAMDTKETQRLLEMELGLDREVFHATVFYGQNDLFHFADTTSDAKRMEIVTKIFGLADIDGWLEAAKEAVRTREEILDKDTLELERLKGEQGVLETNVASYRTESGQWEEARAQSLRKAMVDLNAHEEYVQKARGIVSHEPQVQANYQQVLANQTPIANIDWSQFNQSIQEASTQESHWSGTCTALTHQGNQFSRKREELLEKKEGNCSECGQTITAEHVDKEVAKLDAQLTDLRTKWTEANQKSAHYKGVKAQLESDKETQRGLHHEADKENIRITKEIESQLKDIRESKEYLAKAEPHTVQLREAMVKSQAEPNPWVAKEQQAINSAQASINAVHSKRASVELLSEDLRYYEFWKTALGPKGIKSYVLDAKLQEMTEAANEWVRLLTGGTIWVRFESQKLGRSTKKLSNTIVIRVFRYNPDGTITERNYQSWSGGEKKRVSWAIDFGLSRLIATRASKSYDLLILDEVFKHVDASGGEAVVEMLRHLRREKSSIFVIEHDANFQSHFENRVLVRKKDGQSQIIEESDDVREEESKATPKAPTRVQGRKKKSKRAPRRKRTPAAKTAD